MKIIHTGDFHLQEVGDERWQALEEVLRVSAQKHADVLIIAGDLFDKNNNGATLRAEIHPLFDKYAFQILIIRGNHDINCFDPGNNYGKKVHVFTNFTEPFTIGNVTFWGLPFDRLDESQVYAKLLTVKDRIIASETHILIFHGDFEGDGYHTTDDMGDEDDTYIYMPMKAAFFLEIPFTYVLGGHLHIHHDRHVLPRNCQLIHPGSPVSTRSQEIGQRSMDFIDMPSPPEMLMLDTFYYQPITVKFLGSDTNLRQKIIDAVNTAPSQTKVILTVKGAFDSTAARMTEVELETFLSTLPTSATPAMLAMSATPATPATPATFCRVTVTKYYNKALDRHDLITSHVFQKFSALLLTKVTNPVEQQVMEEILIDAILQKTR